jgi:hypothetical protein
MTPIMVEHNLRTALAVIRGAAALMADPRITGARWDAAAELMTQGLERLALIPGVDMSFWAECEAGRPAPIPRIEEGLAQAG